MVLEVKDQMGQLAWPSEQSIAGWSHVNGQQAAADALKRWNEGPRPAGCRRGPQTG